jgi:hypothetical protein
MGRGLVRSLSALVRGASHYIRVCRTPESGLSQEVGNNVASPPKATRQEDTWVSPTVALELRSMEVDGQGLPGMYTPLGRHPY